VDGTNSEKHGINFLPITAASLYLGKDPNYIKQNYEEMLRECGTSQPPNWKDIQYMYYAFMILRRLKICGTKALFRKTEKAKPILITGFATLTVWAS